MKVPTYKRQLQRTDRTGAGMLTAQVNPNVMALAGQGLEQAGQQLFSFGADMLEVETKKKQLAIKSESSIAVQELDTQLKDIRLTVNKMQNPHQAEAYWVSESEKVLKRINNSLSKEAQSLFSINGQKLYTDANYAFKLDNDPKIPEHTKGIANNERNLILEVVANPKMTLAERVNGMIAIVGGYRKNTDNFKYAEAPVNNVGYSRGGDFTEKDKNLLNVHRLNINNNTVLENADKSITTVYITGIRNPAEGENSPIYAVPGYYNGKKYSKEEEQELQEIAAKEGWFDVYPSDPDAKSHKKRVNKLHKLIDKDGKAYNKLEKTFQEGLNFNLYKEDIVGFEEFHKLNKDSLTTITTDILKYLMHDAEDADDVISDVNEGLITDPIFNSIWPDLPIEEKDSIIRAATDIAKELEDFKDKEIKENDEQYKKEVKTAKDILFNSINYNEAVESHKWLLRMNAYTGDERNKAKKLIEELKNDDNITFSYRSSEEGSDSQTLLDLAQLDIDNELSYDLLLEVKDNLEYADFKFYLAAVKTERKEGLSYALNQFKLEYGYTEQMDMNDNLGKTVAAAFMKSSKKLNTFISENNNATYDEIVAKHEEILLEGTVIFKDILQSARNRSTTRYKDFLKKYDPNLDVKKLTNQEIIDAANLALGSSTIGQTEYDILIDKFGYYQLQEIDLK